MCRIGVISDTHGLLRPEVAERLKGCNVILHAGDIDRPKVLEGLNELAPVYAVRGNADREWAEDIPATRKEELFGLRIFMIHNKKQISEDIFDCDIVICGHSHKYEERFLPSESLPEQAAGDPGRRKSAAGQQKVNPANSRKYVKSAAGQLWLNPGSCGPRRLTMPITMTVIETDGSGAYRVRRVDIPHRGMTEQQGSSEGEKQPQTTGYTEALRLTSAGVASESGMDREMKKIDGAMVASVIRDLVAGKSASAIAKKNKLSLEMAELICRLYLTHPGIDAGGILDKMDIHNK